ncbi:putative oxidoreductase [Corynebacterium occultum]|uniref:Putative oxidoreductase n=1 Tax=Corynebacterium occultum TaxID=2675219 RepID=A0A6B8WA00_9CORY|nr:SDR family oxidoreductase [Corynebacterium occultum]QGU08095.1 putative oxidoreductase [Corynebacterium occultum]
MADFSDFVADSPSDTSARRVAVVTGATGGMGEKIVAELARDHEVLAIGRNPAALKSLAEIPNVRAVPVDLTLLLDDVALNDTPALQELFSLERVDLLVHAAGVMERRTVEDATAADWRLQFAVNATLPAMLSARMLPALRRARGQIIFISSIAGQGAHPGNAVYAASKHALRGIADALRDEVSGDDVRVASISPSGTDTAMMRRAVNQAGEAEYHPEYYTDPVEIARAVRLIADTGESTQFTNLDVRPRRP